jgi:hypothetical protein
MNASLIVVIPSPSEAMLRMNLPLNRCWRRPARSSSDAPDDASDATVTHDAPGDVASDVLPPVQSAGNNSAAWLE